MLKLIFVICTERNLKIRKSSEGSAFLRFLVHENYSIRNVINLLNGWKDFK